MYNYPVYESVYYPLNIPYYYPLEIPYYRYDQTVVNPLPIIHGCVCPGDATDKCKNPMCPRKNPFEQKKEVTC